MAGDDEGGSCCRCVIGTGGKNALWMVSTGAPKPLLTPLYDVNGG
jgi:hypothetical protein